MTDYTAAEHRTESLRLLARGSELPTHSPHREGFLLEALTHATLALSAPASAPVPLQAVPELTPSPTPEPTPSPTDASADEPSSKPSRPAPRRKRTTPSTPTTKDAAA